MAGQQNEVRRIVNEVSANLLLPLVFKENEVFLSALQLEDDRHEFLRLIPHNILTRCEVEKLCAEFNGYLQDVDLDSIQQDGTKIAHPFCELYNCGLIGIVNCDNPDDSAVQQFKQPHHSTSRYETCLPFADFYLLHPSLQPYCATQGAGKAYRLFRYIVVGHDYPWHAFYPALIDLQLAMANCPNEQFVEQIDRYIQFRFSQHREFEIEAVELSITEEELLANAAEVDDDLLLSLDAFIAALRSPSN